MSTLPPWGAELTRYLRSQHAPVLGIVGDEAHTGGYHVGRDRIYRIPPGRGDRDYSVQLARDRAGLTDDASAIDIGRHHQLGDLGRFLYRALAVQAPEASDVREVIAERSDGSKVWRIDDRGSDMAWTPEVPHHLHVSFYRDSRARSKVPLFRAFYEGENMAYPPLYSTGGLQRTFPVGTTYYDEPDGKVIGTIKSEHVVYDCIAQTGDDPLGLPGWVLLDGGGEAGRLRWVLLE